VLLSFPVSTVRHYTGVVSSSTRSGYRGNYVPFQPPASSFIWSEIVGMDGRVGGLDPYSGSQTFNRIFHKRSENPEGGRLGFFPPNTATITLTSLWRLLYGRVPVNTCQRYDIYISSNFCGIHTSSMVIPSAYTSVLLDGNCLCPSPRNSKRSGCSISGAIHLVVPFGPRPPVADPEPDSSMIVVSPKSARRAQYVGSIRMFALVKLRSDQTLRRT
jgi:hypothetical protein